MQWKIGDRYEIIILKAINPHLMWAKTVDEKNKDYFQIGLADILPYTIEFKNLNAIDNHENEWSQESIQNMLQLLSYASKIYFYPTVTNDNRHSLIEGTRALFGKLFMISKNSIEKELGNLLCNINLAKLCMVTFKDKFNNEDFIPKLDEETLQDVKLFLRYKTSQSTETFAEYKKCINDVESQRESFTQHLKNRMSKLKHSTDIADQDEFNKLEKQLASKNYEFDLMIDMIENPVTTVRCIDVNVSKKYLDVEESQLSNEKMVDEGVKMLKCIKDENSKINMLLALKNSFSSPTDTKKCISTKENGRIDEFSSDKSSKSSTNSMLAERHADDSPPKSSKSIAEMDPKINKLLALKNSFSSPVDTKKCNSTKEDGIKSKPLNGSLSKSSELCTNNKASTRFPSRSNRNYTHKNNGINKSPEQISQVKSSSKILDPKDNDEGSSDKSSMSGINSMQAERHTDDFQSKSSKSITEMDPKINKLLALKNSFSSPVDTKKCNSTKGDDIKSKPLNELCTNDKASTSFPSRSGRSYTHKNNGINKSPEQIAQVKSSSKILDLKDNDECSLDKSSKSGTNSMQTERRTDDFPHSIKSPKSITEMDPKINKLLALKNSFSSPVDTKKCNSTNENGIKSTPFNESLLKSSELCTNNKTSKSIPSRSSLGYSHENHNRINRSPEQISKVKSSPKSKNHKSNDSKSGTNSTQTERQIDDFPHSSKSSKSIAETDLKIHKLLAMKNLL